MGIKTFSGAVTGEPSFIGKTTCYHIICCICLFLTMGKEKITPKEVRPSTTRGGTDLPSRPNFSPNAASAVAPKKKGKVVSSSP